MSTSIVTPDVLATIVQLACRAPSLHNSQPWHVRAHDGELRIFVESDRALHATDPRGREVLIIFFAVL